MDLATIMCCEYSKFSLPFILVIYFIWRYFLTQYITIENNFN